MLIKFSLVKHLVNLGDGTQSNDHAAILPFCVFSPLLLCFNNENELLYGLLTLNRVLGK